MVEGKKSVVKPIGKKSVSKPIVKKPVVRRQISEAKKLEKSTTFGKIMEPPHTKFKLRNVLQAIVGATVLAIPIGFTEETWRLGETLPIWNIVMIFFISILFVALFAYRHFRKNKPDFYWYELVKRVVVIYSLSFVVVALILFIIQKAPWNLDFILSLKRTIIVALPSALGATIAGSLK